MLIGLAPTKDIREIFIFHEVYTQHSHVITVLTQAFRCRYDIWQLPLPRFPTRANLGKLAIRHTKLCISLSCAE